MSCFDQYWNSIRIGGFAERNESDLTQFDCVINVSQKEFSPHDMYYPLSDIPNTNTQQEFAEAVSNTVQAIQNNSEIFIHCAKGQSRSVIVLATALAELCNETYKSAIEYLQQNYSQRIYPTDSLVVKSKKYLTYTQY